MEKVIAVVVTYNRLALLSECIAALRNQTRPLDGILVINNGSTDGTEAWLKSQRIFSLLHKTILAAPVVSARLLKWDTNKGMSGYGVWMMTAYPKKMHWKIC